MTDIEIQTEQTIKEIFQQGILPLLSWDQNVMYVRDPIFKIKRNRVTAEILQTMIQADIGTTDQIRNLSTFLIKTQKEKGCWNEIHPNYDQPSALITSFVGDALLDTYKKKCSLFLEDAIHKAKNYVLSQEKKLGYFLKSSQYTADHLNVDASCGAFLANYGNTFHDDLSLDAGIRAADHITKHQWKSGVYPYTITKGTYSYNQNIPCMHYQAVTLFYLIKIQQIIQKKWLRQSILKGGYWLKDMQKKNGSFHWEKSGLLFAYYLTGSYAFATSAFYFLSKYDQDFKKHAERSLQLLNKNKYEGLLLRWEKARWASFFPSIVHSCSTTLIGRYTANAWELLFRFNYAMYRQIARRRIKRDIDSEIFKKLTRIFKLTFSTIEPFNNYPDLFITTESIDVLSWLLSQLRGGNNFA